MKRPFLIVRVGVILAAGLLWHDVPPRVVSGPSPMPPAIAVAPAPGAASQPHYTYAAASLSHHTGVSPPRAAPGAETATPIPVAQGAAAPTHTLFRRDRPFFGEKHPGPVESAAADEALPRLFGTFVGPNGRRALFAEAGEGSRDLVEGQVLGRYVIRAIMPGMVVLNGPEGERVLYTTHAKAAPR